MSDHMPMRKHKKANSVPKRRATTIAGVVPHPRYGNTIVSSGCNVASEEIRASFYRYRGETIFPESVIQADTTRQNFTVFPRGYYVDMLKLCRTCRRPFIFFAREQRHWYEILRFYIDADCVHCPECRRSNQELRRRFRRYSESIGHTDLNDNCLMQLAEDALFLWKAGVVRDEQRLRELRKLAMRRIPGTGAATSIDQVLAELKPAQSLSKKSVLP